MVKDPHNLLASAHPRLVDFASWLGSNRPELDVQVVSALRSDAEQEEIYSLGRYATQAVLNKYHPEETAPGTKRTNARAGGSSHNPDKMGRALGVDFHILDGGDLLQDDGDTRWDDLGAAVPAFNAAVPGEPLAWGGSGAFTRALGRADKPHVQLEAWKTLRELPATQASPDASGVADVTPQPRGHALLVFLGILAAGAAGALAYFHFRG